MSTASVVVTAATESPVTPSEAKAYLRIDHSDDDVMISDLIASATHWVQAYTRRQLLTCTVTALSSGFDGYSIPLAYPPLQEISSVQYYDESNTLTTMAAARYTYLGLPDYKRAALLLDQNYAIPAVYNRDNAVAITYVAGWDAPQSVPSPIRQAIMYLVADMYENRTPTEAGGPNQAVITAMLRQYRDLRFA